MKPFTLHEVKKVVFSLSLDKSPVPDGFTILFYQKFWNFLGFELLLALEESRRNGLMLKNFNVTNITIIPKLKQPKTFANFRPISLCNSIYKIFTKAIYCWLQHLIPKLIYQEQGGFFTGRETSKGSFLAHEVPHSVKAHHIPSFIVKLDMMKAYDKVDWIFLLKVLT